LRPSSRSSWSRALDWSGARLPHFEKVALACAALVLAVYGGVRLQTRAAQAQESRQFNEALESRAQARFYEEVEQSWREPERDPVPEAEPAPDANPVDDSVRRAEALLAPEPAMERLRQTEWSPRRRKAYEETLTAGGALPLGRLEIPSIDLSVMVLPGTDDWTLNRAVGHIEGTAMPGEHGNIGIAGHRDGFFRGLRHLKHGERIHLTTLEGSYTYEVSDIQVVQPTRVDVLDPSDSPSLTLVTCYPFYHVGSAPQRYIIRATITSPLRAPPAARAISLR
jgi:sortase A